MIQRIRLKNFKSFKKAEISFDYPFVAITGPNGSGKSNIVDSILFCLGLKHSKVLRADKLTDLIRIGCNEAEVEITFKNGLKVRRRVKKTEKGYYSYYYLNDRSVGYSEIERALEELGIVNDYNVVMQGDVTRIAEMSPVQRRKIIEDIAGISEFDEKKEKALHELEVVRENIEKLEAIISEVNSRLESLRRDREEALRYKSLLEEREKLHGYLRAHEYLRLKNRKESLENEIERLEVEKDELARKIVGTNLKLQELNVKAEEISERIAKIGDIRFKEIQSEVIRINSEIEAIIRSERIYLREIKKLEEDRTKALLEISKLREELGKVEKEMEDLLIQKASVGELVNEKMRRMEELKVRLDEMGVKFGKIKDELVEKRETLERLKEKRNELVRERDRTIEALRRIGMEIDDLELEKERVKIERLFEELRGKKDELERKEKSLKALIERRNEIDRKIFSLRDELAELEEIAKGKEIELAKIRTELSTVERFSRAVEIVLEAKEKGILKNIYGTVAQLGEVDEKFALALEVAAGNALQFIVVETEDDAVEAIKFLKRVEGGRASFIPLNKIRNFGVYLDGSVLKEKGVVDYAVNLVKCEKKFKPVFEFVYRDTLVVEDIDTAKRLMDGRRIVTLDGDLIERSGVMSGGSVQRRKGVLLSKELLNREKKIKEEIEEISKRKEEILDELKGLENLRRSIQAEIDELNLDVAQIKSEISALESKIEEYQKLLESIKLKLNEKRVEMAELNSKAERIEEELGRVEMEISKVSKEIGELERRLKGSEVAKLSEELERVREEYSRNREILVEIESFLKNAELRREQILRSIEEREGVVNRIDARVGEIRKEIERGKEKVKELKKELERLKAEEEKLGKETKALREKRDRILDEIRRLEKEKDRAEFGIRSIEERIKAKREELGRICRELESLGEVELEDLPPVEVVEERLREVEAELSEFGDVNMKAIQEFEEVKARRDDLMEKKRVLEKERREIMERIRRYERMKREAFFKVFNAINENFREIVKELADGEGELYLDGEDPFSSGLHIKFKPFGKKVQKMEAMSGGEKSLAALALIFAIQRFKPAPFYVFDEVDMFLDGVNVGRVAKMIKKLSKDAQFIVVSLRKPMLEMADAVIGVTRGEDSSIVTAIRLK